MRKLMKRYERVELQYNLNGVRNQLLEESGMSGIDFSETLTIDTTPPPVEQLPAIA